MGLNPCCDGMFSILREELRNNPHMSLNPCCDGMFSIMYLGRKLFLGFVLILVVMGCFLLELRQQGDRPTLRLNPCCDGMFSIIAETTTFSREGKS